jgi:hypothetical protein
MCSNHPPTVCSYNYAPGKLLTVNLGTVLQRSSQLNHETAPARAALAEKNNPEQSPKKAISRKQLLKTPEQKSSFIVKQ